MYSWKVDRQRFNATADVEEQVKLAAQLVEIAQEGFWQIGIASAPDGYGIVRNNLHNVIDHPGSFFYPSPGPTNPETWYFDLPQQ